MAAVRKLFQYAVLRAVPRVERGESVNVAVVLYCQDANFLALEMHLDQARLRCLDPAVDLEGVQQALQGMQRVCAGEGPAGRIGLGQRFRWLTSARSTVLQVGSAHSGLTVDPQAELARLLTAVVK